jgi:AcrR family transcriptional regulator
MESFNKLSSDKKERIIDASLKEFGKYGYVVASTNRIVKEVGISKGSLFKYFSSKQALYKYLVELTIADLINYLNYQPLVNYEWDEIILYYAEKEFDYLVNNRVLYQFFKKMLTDIDLEELSHIRSYLLHQSSQVYQKLYDTLNLDINLSTHIMFIIKGYNEYYYRLNHGTYHMKMKVEYIDGLKKHLSYINL